MSNREHLDWLMEQAADSAREYVKHWAKLQTLEVDSEEHATLEGLMLAVLYQVEIDAIDVREEHDRWLDSLPEDEDEEVRA